MSYEMLKELLIGLGVSVTIFWVTLMISLPLGLVIALGRMSRIRILSLATKLYISIMRGTPLMLQIMVVYFGPYYLFKVHLFPEYRLIAVNLAFGINYAAYFAEIYRGGIEAIPKGQHEAAHVLGYSKCQTFFKIVMPQVIRHILPAVTNEVITLVKDTSLSSTIAVLEMFTTARHLASSMTSMTPLIAAGIFYYIFNFIVASAMEYLEKRLNYYR